MSGNRSRSKGQRAMAGAMEMLESIIGRRCYVVHRARQEDPGRADILADTGGMVRPGVQVKALQKAPAWLEGALSEDGFCLLRLDGGRWIFIAEVRDGPQRA